MDTVRKNTGKAERALRVFLPRHTQSYLRYTAIERL